MTDILLYHVSLQDFGDRHTFIPAVPSKRAVQEDRTMPRVCACLTLPDCLKAMELTFDAGISLDGDTVPVYVYTARVPVESIHQPDTAQVPDAWMTGELWVMDAVPWTLTRRGYLRRHMDFAAKEFVTGNEAVFSRYAFTPDGEDEVVDKYRETVLYGDMDGFSFLELNPFLTNRQKDIEQI